MLASRQTASLADGVIRLHASAPLPGGRDGCSKCKCFCRLRPLKNIDAGVVWVGSGSGSHTPCSPCANTALICVWRQQRVALGFHEPLRYWRASLVNQEVVAVAVCLRGRPWVIRRCWFKPIVVVGGGVWKLLSVRYLSGAAAGINSALLLVVLVKPGVALTSRTFWIKCKVGGDLFCCSNEISNL